MLHRDKRIGKSLYRVVSRPGGYAIKEIYNDYNGKSETFAMGISKQIYPNVDDALTDLSKISVERYYTDDSKNLNY